MDEYMLQILGLSETKKVGSGKIEIAGTHTLYYSGVKQGQRAKEGVGILVTKEIDKRITDFKPISSRIMSLKVKMEEDLNIVQIYAPIEGTEEQKIIDFYTQLQETLDSLREKSERVIIMGDWNARIGNDRNRGNGCTGNYGETTCNRNGSKMLEFCQSNDLKIGNTFHPQPLQERFTYVAEGRDAKSIIDYITHTHELSPYFKLIQVINAAEIGTPHRLVKAELNMNISVTEEVNEYSKIIIHKLKFPEAKKQYQEETDESFRNMKDMDRDWNLEDMWGTFREVIYKKAEEICGRRTIRKSQKRTRWWNMEIQREVKMKKEAWKRFNRTKLDEDRQYYVRLRDSVKAHIKEAKRRSWEEFGEELNLTHDINYRQFWNKIKALGGRKRKVLKGIKNKENSLKITTTEILETWKEHYKEKFQGNVDTNEWQLGENGREEEEELEEISMEELEQGLYKIKLGKACGADDLDPEMIKWLGAEGKEWLLEIYRLAWRRNEIPKDWEENLIIPIHKKGEETDCDNYRAICLASVATKVYTRIIEGRIRRVVEHKLNEEQTAFRKGRQTSDNIFVLRHLIDRRGETGEELFITFIDLKAAFDSIERTFVWETMREMKIPHKLIQVVMSVYRNVTGKVVLNGKKSQEFEIKKGLKQGDSLSPLLFILIMDKILANTRERTRNLSTTIGYRHLAPVTLDGLLYADDIVLVAETQRKMQALVDVWVEQIEEMGMEVNIKKCKYMTINQKTTVLVSGGGTTIKGEQIEQVTAFEYLGVMFTSDGKMDMEIANRVRKTTRIYYALYKPIFGKKEIESKTKLQVYNAISVPTLLYGSESWVTNTKHESAITAAEMKQLRKIVGKTRLDKVRNETIRDQLQQESIIQKMEKRKLNWFGHMIRMGDNRLVKRAMEAKRVGRRRKGRPKKTWLEQMAELGKAKGKSWNEMRTMARDRTEWKKWVKASENPTPTPD